MSLKICAVLASVCLLSFAVSAQNKTYQIKADSVRIFSNCDTAELILQNRTRNVLNGALFNKGNGVTEFRKILTRINSCTYLIGADSLKLDACNGAGSGSMAWLLNGNNLGGIYKTFGTTDNVDLPIITNNTEKMRVMANGNIGIGTSAPAAKLHITNALGTILINPNLSRPADVIRVGGYINTTDGQNVLLSSSSDGGNNFRNLLVERDGYLGIGSGNNTLEGWVVGNPALRFMPAPDGRISIASNYLHFGTLPGPYNCSALVTYVSDADEWVTGQGKVKGQNYYYFGTVLQTPTPGNTRSPLKISGNELQFLTGDGQATGENFYGRGAEAMRISATGNVGIGTSGPTAKLHTVGTVRFEGLPAGSGDQLVIDAAGNITRGGGTPSDFNLKENIAFSQFNSNKLLGLIIKDFNYKSDKNKTRYTGLIAQELKAVIPELVLGAEGNYSIDYIKMVPYLLKAVQDQQATMLAQQKEIDHLKLQLTTAANAPATNILSMVQQQLLQQKEEIRLLKEQIKRK